MKEFVKSCMELLRIEPILTGDGAFNGYSIFIKESKVFDVENGPGRNKIRLYESGADELLSILSVVYDKQKQD